MAEKDTPESEKESAAPKLGSVTGGKQARINANLQELADLLRGNPELQRRTFDYLEGRLPGTPEDAARSAAIQKKLADQKASVRAKLSLVGSTEPEESVIELDQSDIQEVDSEE